MGRGGVVQIQEGKLYDLEVFTGVSPVQYVLFISLGGRYMDICCFILYTFSSSGHAYCFSKMKRVNHRGGNGEG